MSLSAAVDGTPRLVADVNTVVGDLVESVETTAAEIIYATALPKTPVLSGALKAGFTQAGPVITASAPYAVIVHARNPWITTAAKASETQQATAAEARVQQPSTRSEPDLMQIKRRHYLALLADGDAERAIAGDLRHGDDLRAELEARKHAITTEQPQHYGTVTVWAAARRLQQTDLDYQAFAAALVELNVNQVDVDVDPTRPATAGGSPSPSPATTPASPGPSGSTTPPTPTG